MFKIFLETPLFRITFRASVLSVMADYIFWVGFFFFFFVISIVFGVPMGFGYTDELYNGEV